MLSEPYFRAMDRAEMLLRAGNGFAAVDPLRDALSIAPDEPHPHLLLAEALRIQNRLVGARYEAERALTLAPEWDAAYLELAVILTLQLQSKDALEAVDKAIDLQPHSAHAHLLRARLLRDAGRREQAAEALANAARIDPVSPAIIAERGYAALERGDIDATEQAGREILAHNPASTDGLVLTGDAQLARGDVAEAHRLALDALSNEATDLAALNLLAAVKAKRNPLGGLWWRWNRLLVKLGEARAIYFVVSIWVLYSVADLAARDLGAPSAFGTILVSVYLAFVIYTLSAHAIVRSLVSRELEQVRIKPDF